MEAETNSPEEASTVSVPLVKPIANIGSEEIKFLQQIGSDVNSRYPLVEEKWKSDSSKTSEVSETRPQDIYQESCKVSVKSEEQTEHQPEGYSIEKKILRDTDLEGPVITESIPNSSEHEDESISILPELAINQVEMTEKGFEKEKDKEEESTALDNDQSYTPQNEPEQTSKALEAIDVTQFMGKDTADNEHADHQSEAPSMENVNKEAAEVELQNSETESAPEDRILQTLSTTAYVGSEAFDKSIQEEIHPEEESEVTTTKEEQIPENYFEQKMEVPKAFGLHQGTHQTNAENVIPAETLIEAQNQENTNIKYPNLEGETTEIKPTNDTEEQEKVPVSHTEEKLENEDDGKFKQEKAKETEEATQMQLLKTATDSPSEDKVQSTMPTYEIVKGVTEEMSQHQTHKNDETAVIDTDKSSTEKYKLEDDGKSSKKEEKPMEEATKTKLPNTVTERLPEEEVQPRLPTPAIVHHDIDQIIQQQPLHHDESQAIDNSQSCIAENEIDKMSTIVEVLEQPETKDVSIVKEEQTDHQSEESSVRSVITNYETVKGHITSENRTKLSDDVDEQKTVESCLIENLENKDAGEITVKEATNAKELSDVEIRKSQTEGVSKHNALQTIPNTTLVRNEAVDESSQEERQPEEFTEKFNKEGQTPQHATEDTAKINTTNHTEEEEEVPTSHAMEKLEIEDDGKFNQEATKTQLHEEEVQPRFPTPAIVQGDTDQIIEQPLHQDESQVIDNAKSYIAENEHDKMSTFDKEPKQPESKDNVGIVKEEQKDHQSKESSVQSVITNYITARGHVTLESSTKLSDDVDVNEQKTVESPSVKNLKNEHVNEVLAKEATNAKQSIDVKTPKSEAEGVPEDNALQTLPSMAPVEIEAVDESCQEDMHQESEFDVTYVKEEQTPQHEFNAKNEILEEETCQLDAENEQKSESWLAAQNDETTFIKHPYSDTVTVEINTTNDTKEQADDSTSHTMEKLAIKDDEKFDQEEAIGSEEETETRLLNTATESLPEEEVQTKLPASAYVQCDIDRISRHRTLHNHESKGINNATIVEEHEQLETEDNVSIVKQQQANHQSEESGVPEDKSMYTIPDTSIINEADDENSQQERQQEAEFTEKFNKEVQTPQYDTERTAEIKTNDIEEQEDILASNAKEKQWTEDDGKLDQEEAKRIEDLTKTQLLEEKLQTTLLTPDFVQGDTDQISQQQKMHDDESKGIKNAKIGIPEIELGGTSTIEEYEQLETTKDNIDIVKQEQADHQSEDSTVPSVITNYITTEGHITLESNTKLIDDVNVDEQKTIDSRSVENLENKDASEITTEEATNGKQSTDVEITKSDIEGVPEDKALHTIPSTTIKNEADGEISQQERQQEAKFTQQQTLHDDESKAIDNAKTSCIPKIELDRKPTTIKELEQPETKDNLSIVNEEQIDHQPEESSVQSVTNCIIAEGRVTLESSTKYSDGDNINQQLCSIDNLENKDASETTANDIIVSKQLIDVDIPTSDTEGVLEDKALQTIHDATSIGNEAVESSQEERQLEVVEFIEMYNNEVCTPPYDTEKTIEINTKNDTEKHEVPISHAKDKLGIEDDGKFDQEEATKSQLPKEEVQTTLSTPDFVQDDTNKILQQQKMLDVELEGMGNAKIGIPEIEFGETSIVEEPEQLGTKDNISIVKEEQTDHRSEDSSVPSVVTNYITIERQVTSESNTKLIDDVNVDEQKIVDSRSKENLENKDASEITTKEAFDAKESANIEIPKSEIEGVPKDTTLQTIPNTTLVGNEVVDESTQEARQPEVEFSEKFNKEMQTIIYVSEETAEVNTTNDIEEQEEVPAPLVKQKLVIEDDDKLDQEEAKGIEEAIKIHLPKEELPTRLPIPAFFQGETDQFLQQQTLNNDESKVIDRAEKSYIPKIEHDGMSTIVEEPSQPKTKDNFNTVQEEQANYLSEDLSMRSVIINCITVEGHVISENRTKLIDVRVDEQKIVDSSLVENLENKDASESIVEEATNVKQSIDVEIPKSEIKGVLEDKVLQIIPNATLVENEAVGVKQEEKQPEVEFAKKFNKEVQAPTYDTKETIETNTNDIEKQEEFPTYQAKEKLEIKDDGKIDQEAKGIEEATKTQLPRKEIQTPLPTLSFVQGDINQILQQQTLHNNESEGIENANKIDIPEIEHDGTSIVEVPKQFETKDKISIVKEEQADHQSEDSSVSSVIRNYIIIEGHITSESNASLKNDVNVDEQKIVDSSSIENLENNDASEITTRQAAYAKQSTGVDLPNSAIEATGELEDKALQTISGATSIRNETIDESCQQGKQSETEFTKKFYKEVQTPVYVSAETIDINATNDIKEQEKVPTSHAKEKLVIEDGGKFDKKEAKQIKEAKKMQILEEEVQTTLPTVDFVEGDIDRLHHRKTPHDDEATTIQNGKKICIPEIELRNKSIVVEELEIKDNIDMVKEDQANHQLEESSMSSIITNYTTIKGHITLESSKNIADEVNIDGQQTIHSHLTENIQNKDASEIIEGQLIDARELIDVEIPQSKTKGVPEDKTLQTIIKATLVKNKVVDESSQQERHVEAKFVEKFDKEVQTPQYDTNVTIEINNDTKTQEDVLASLVMEKLGIENDGKFDQEEATKTQLSKEEVQELEQPKTKDNMSIVKEEQVDHQSRESSMLIVITKYVRAEEDITSESRPKLKDDVHVNEQKIIDSFSVENLVNKDASEITEEEGENAKQVTDAVIQNSKIEGVLEDKTLQTLPNATSIKNETVDESRQEEIQPEEEFAMIYTKKESICQLTVGNKHKLESQATVQNDEITFKKHPYFDGETVEINLDNDTTEQKEFLVSLAKEKLGVKDDGKFDQEEVKRIEEATKLQLLDTATKMQLLDTATKGLQMEEVQPYLPTPTNAHGDLDQILQQQTLDNDESEVIHNAKSCVPENKLERMSFAVEDTNKPEVMANIRTIKEEQADYRSEASSMQSAISNYTNVEGFLASKGVPEDEVKTTLPTSTIIKGESIEGIIQEKTLEEEEEPTTIDNNNGIPENELEQMTNVVETIDQHETMAKVNVEHEEQANHHHFEQSIMENVITKHINLEGRVTTKYNTKSGYDVEELEKVLNTKALQKKSHGILSSVGSKVKHSISKVKKAITSKSSNPKTPPSSK